MKITANIITLNEETNIVDCVESLQEVCDEIIVVDSLSSDKTVELARQMGAKVILQEYLGDGPQKNVAAKHTDNDWILSIDADERLDEKMKQTILNLKKHDKPSSYAYGFRRKNFIADRWIKHSGWYPDVCVRLYRKDKTAFSNVAGHASVKAQNFEVLDGHIIHYSYKNYHDLLHKTNRFSTRGAKMFMQKGKKVNAFSPVLHFFFAFWKKYLLKLGILDGLDGFTVSLTAAINSYMKYAKYIEMLKSDNQSKSLWEQ